VRSAVCCGICACFIVKVETIIDVLTLIIDYLLCMLVQQCCAEIFRFCTLPMTIVLFFRHVAEKEKRTTHFEVL
jgi:hypothetical protein